VTSTSSAVRPAGARPRVALVDYGMGNLASVAKALERAGGEVRLVDRPAGLGGADAVVLPGVGAFRDAAARLEATGLGAAARERIAAGVPFLGVCLGLQLLFESSGEGGRWQGLGVFAGTVERLETDLKVPHIGWNELEWQAAGAGMARGLPAPAAVYFVHSYAARPADPGCVAAVTDYGGPVVAAVARDNVWAVQFHPEKSSAAGLTLLANFVAGTRAAGAALVNEGELRPPPRPPKEGR
jgi:glutamine amidotransferase